MRKRVIAYSMIFVLILLTFTACEFDLNVPNPNAPDLEQALSDPQTIENLIGSSFLAYWQGIHFFAPSLTLSTMADELSSSWGIAAVYTMSSEPRQAWNNSIAYDKDYQEVNYWPWRYLYKAISACSDGLKVIQDGLRIRDAQGTDNTVRCIAFAKFVIGLSHAWLGCFFDKGYSLDERVDLEEADLVLRPYSELVEKGVELLEVCIAICDTSSFQLPDNWINGCTLNQDGLKALAHSYAARFLAFKGRSISERDAEDWESIRSHAEQGVTWDFYVMGSGVYEKWWSGLHYLGQSESWVRADYKTIGPADTSENYQNWLAQWADDRQPFLVYTPDLRLCSGEGAGGIDRDGTDFSYKDPIPFNPMRGTYHFSWYFHDRYIEHLNTDGISPMPEFLAAEIDLILAEYYLRKGDGAQAAFYINKTRTTRGGLRPVTAADGIGSVTDPRSIYGSLWATLKYEKGIELFCSYPGGAFFDRRGWGELVKDTPIHFPIPAREIEILGMDTYTFGGGGPGSAPKRFSNKQELNW